jgi:Thioredoxin-like domain
MEGSSTAPGNFVRLRNSNSYHRETAAIENSSIFWPLLEALSKKDILSFQTDREYYTRALDLLRDEFLTDSVTLGSFELGLSLHNAAPKIEAYYQFYNTSVVPSLGDKYISCDTWVYWRGQQLCAGEGLETRLRDAPPENLYSVLKS